MGKWKWKWPTAVWGPAGGLRRVRDVGVDVSGRFVFARWLAGSRVCGRERPGERLTGGPGGRCLGNGRALLRGWAFRAGDSLMMMRKTTSDLSGARCRATRHGAAGRTSPPPVRRGGAVEPWSRGLTTDGRVFFLQQT